MLWRPGGRESGVPQPFGDLFPGLESRCFDLAKLRYRTIDREPLRGNYHGFEIVGPPPPSSGPLHIIQMLNILEGYDIGALGFGSADTLHLLAEVLKIAFADRAAATADPAFVIKYTGIELSEVTGDIM